MIRLKNISQSKGFKKVLEALNEDEIKQVDESIGRTISSEIRNLTRTYEMEAGTLKNDIKMLAKYKGFYDCLINDTLNTAIGGDYLTGVEEAIKYLKNRPDKIIQHLTDPNPPTKYIQHLKDDI